MEREREKRRRAQMFGFYFKTKFHVMEFNGRTREEVIEEGEKKTNTR